MSATDGAFLSGWIRVMSDFELSEKDFEDDLKDLVLDFIFDFWIARDPVDWALVGLVLAGQV